MERLDARLLGTDAVEIHWTEPARALGLESEAPYRFPIVMDLFARRFDTRVVVTGRVGCKVRLECSRCLDSFERGIEAQVSIECQEGPPPERHEDEVREDDPDGVWYEAPFVDLTDEMRQIVLVATPDYPVCREGCRGLCPECGANLNNGACACGRSGTAKPFEALGTLLHAMKEQQRHG